MRLRWRYGSVAVAFVVTNIVLYRQSVPELTRSADSKAPRQTIITSTPPQPFPARPSPQEIERRFQARRRTLHQACQKYSGQKDFFSGKLGPLKILVAAHPPDLNATLSYCPIPKIGYKTWWDILASLQGNDPKVGSRAKGGQGQGQNTLTKTGQGHDTFRKARGQDHDRFIKDGQGHDTISKGGRVQGHDTVTFVFVREPYSRVFSAYVDKLYVPNRYFDSVGRYIVKMFRWNPSRESLRFGHDVTFPEFVKYVIHAETTGRERDRHFVPLRHHCDLCRRDFQYIGHMETFSQDKEFILKAAQTTHDFTQDFSESTLEVDLHWMLEEYTVRCMSIYEALRRLWRSWQIRGVLHKHAEFPLSAEDVHNITNSTKDSVKVIKDTMVRVALEAQSRSRSRTKAALQLQRSEAMREAYGTVPLEDRLKLKELLSVDCEMFGYDPDLPEVFPTKEWTPPSDFTYLRF